MTARICRCCGEPMAEGANAHSRNPNICASCSSIVDGMSESIEAQDVAAVLKILTEHLPTSAPPAPRASPRLVDGPT